MSERCGQASTEGSRADRKREFFAGGARDVAPILLGVAPFATIAGISAVEAGLSRGAAVLLSIFVFAGAAQLAAMQLLAAGAASFAVIYTALVVNLRFVVYSASIAPHFRNLPRLRKLLYAYILTDQGYALSALRLSECRHPDRHWYYVGASVPIWFTWQLFSALGIFLGSHVPEAWDLGFAVPLTFLAVLVGACDDWKSSVAAASAGAVAVAAHDLPMNLGLFAGVLAGIAAGFFVDCLYPLRTEREVDAG